MHDLDAIAATATEAVTNEAPSVNAIRRGARRRRDRRRAALAAGVVLILTVATLGFSRLGAGDPGLLVTADAGPGFNPLTEVPSPWNVVVILDPDSTAEQIAEIDQLLDGSSAVGNSTLVSRNQMLAELRSHVEAEQLDPALLDEDLVPPSFRLTIDRVDDPLIAMLNEHAAVARVFGSVGELPKPISAYGTPIFDQLGSARVFLASRAGVDESIERCLAEAGFRSLEPDSGAGSWASDYRRDVIEHVDDEVFAAAWGFGVLPVHEAPTDRVAQPNLGLDEDHPYNRALYGGLFSGGCSDDAYDQWSAGERSVNQHWEELTEAKSRFAADDRVIDFYASWSECMATEGFVYSSPYAAFEFFVAIVEGRKGELGADADRLVGLEINTAMATVTCGSSSSAVMSASLASAWEDYADGDWAENRHRALDSECRPITPPLDELLAAVRPLPSVDPMLEAVGPDCFE